ncbi:MAG: GntR family transcriptional regulator [Candidatus Eremiobacteraeota bacterium]|nr:GntR family transcriptional regulator [Candidatus Eremiobacteraeota bacterium]
MSSPEVVVERLRADIIAGRLRPESPLRQDELARKFGISHIPVREAFRRLEAEGLVSIRPRRGAIVAGLSAREIQELNEMRVALECCALRLAIPKIDECRLREASRILDHIDRQPEHWASLNTDFHCKLYEAADRPRLLETIRALQRNVERYLRTEVEVLGNLEASQDEHRTMLHHVKCGDAEAACALLVDHIVEPNEVLVAHLQRSGLE